MTLVVIAFFLLGVATGVILRREDLDRWIGIFRSWQFDDLVRDAATSSFNRSTRNIVIRPILIRHLPANPRTEIGLDSDSRLPGPGVCIEHDQLILLVGL